MTTKYGVSTTVHFKKNSGYDLGNIMVQAQYVRSKATCLRKILYYILIPYTEGEMSLR